MEYFSIIYAILKAIEKSMDVEEFDGNSISAEFLHISQTRWEIIMCELVRNGYISGVYIVPIAGREVPGIKVERPILTIKGAEYLQENTMMKKAYRLAKGIKDIFSKEEGYMSNNDYPVIVYYILSYLYRCLKEDTPIDVDVLSLKKFSSESPVSMNYLYYIYKNLMAYGYVEGPKLEDVVDVCGKPMRMVSLLDRAEITPVGISWLLDKEERLERIRRDRKCVHL